MLLDYAQPERERTLLPIMTYKQEISEEITPAEYDLASALEAHVSFSNVMQVSKRNFEEHEAYYEKGTPGRGSIICEINSETKPRLDAQLLARKWGIGLDAAKRTIRATTSRGIRSVLDPTISRRYPTNDRQLRYRRLPLEMYSDTMKASVRSRNGNKYAQVYCTRSGWTLAIPMQSKSDAHETLSLLFSRHGVPNILIVDGAKEQVQGKFKRKARQADCRLKRTEPYSPWANAAEGAIRELKKSFGRKMLRSKAPRKLWDHCLMLEATIRAHTAHDIFELNGEVPETLVSGQTPDISPFAQHEWYEWVKFRDTKAPFPDNKYALGRYLGPSVDVGPAMTAKMLKANGQILHRTTYRALTDHELNDKEAAKEREEFDESIRKKLGAEMDSIDFPADDFETPTYEPYQDENGDGQTRAPDVEDVTPEAYDLYLNAEVLLPRGDGLKTGKVKRRKRDADGELRGLANNNPILDTRTYEVEFPDGQVTEYAANVIAENMWSQCDIEGNQMLLMQAITDYKTDGHAVAHADRHITVAGKQHLRKTTKGWHLCIQWKDGTTTWERLADVKESNPIEVAEYAVAQGIDHEPAFAWWVPHTLKKRNRMIAAVNMRYHKTTHKFGLRVPKNVAECQAIDKENGNTLWMDAVKKEMEAVRIAFKIIGENEPLPGYQEIPCHLIFTIKMEDFRRKARYVAGGHRTEAPATLTYASVVSRDTVRIALTLAALNGLEVKTSDIQNAYLTAPCAEKIWTRLGPEFGPDQGRRAIVVRSLYGLKSAGASFRNHLASCMRTLEWKPCLADPDLWMKPMTRTDDNSEYYAYILLYVDDCLAISEDATKELHALDHYFKMKKGSIGNPEMYLGAKLRLTKLPNGILAWGISASKYVQEAVRNVEVYIRNNKLPKLAKRATAPLPADYHSELDTSKELDPVRAKYYQSQIGILRWAVELGRVDIITEVSTLASHLALPREGHLDALFQIYAYLKKRHNSRIILDPTYLNEPQGEFIECDWKEFYGNVKEPIPPNAPRPLGKEVDLRLYTDSSHADDKLTRRSRTGYFVFMNMALIDWMSKKQATVETSTFGAEFVALKHGIERVRGLRYKLRMMGVQISGPTDVYGDNMSVIKNTQRPESTLKKKSNSICYHASRESVAMNESRMAHISTNENPADIASKIVGGGRKRTYLVGKLLHDIEDDRDEHLESVS